MQGTDQSELTYSQVDNSPFYNQNLANIACSISQRLSQIYQNISNQFEVSSKKAIDASFTLSVRKCFKKLSYEERISKDPICSSKIYAKAYKCFDCLIEPQRESGYLCSSCFVSGNHMKHRFRILQVKSFTICDCGNPQFITKQHSCPNHNEDILYFERLKIKEKDQKQFIKEMQFVLYVFFRICRIQANLIDIHHKKETVWMVILNQIEQFILNSYYNKLIVSSLFQSQFQNRYPPLSTNQHQNHVPPSILHYLIQESKFLVLTKYLNYLLLQLFSVTKLRQQITIQYFSITSSHTNCHLKAKALSHIAFKYLQNGKMIECLQRSNRLEPFIINYNFQNFNDKKASYEQLYRDYNIILSLSNSSFILQNILQKINICQLSNFWSIQDQKTQHESVKYLEILYFKIFSSIMKNLKNTANFKSMLLKIIKQTYHYLSNTAIQLNSSINRTFSFAIFAYFEGNIDAIQQIQDKKLLDLLGQTQQQSFYQTIENLITKLLYKLTKVANFNNVRNLIKDSYPPQKNHLLISIDSIFAKILLNITRKGLQGSNLGIQTVHKFLNARNRSQSMLFEMYYNEHIPAMQVSINAIFTQIYLGIINLIFIVQTNIDELIAGYFLGYVENIEVFELFDFLSYIYKTQTPKQFLEMARIYIKDSPLIKKYLKQQFQNNKRQLAKGKIPLNIFNLSFNSKYFLSCPITKDQLKLYMLKLKSSKRTVYSELVFNSQIQEIIHQIFKDYFNHFFKHFRQNQLNHTRDVFVIMFDSLITLYLQTKDSELKQIIQSIIKEGFQNYKWSKYVIQLINLYSRSERQLQLEKQTISTTTLDEMLNKFKKQRAKKKRQQKMKSIKDKQIQFLNQVPQDILNEEAVSLPNSILCIVCKQSSEQGRLYYLSRFRNSYTIIKSFLNINYPLLLITTCGHMIHKTCMISQEQNLTCFLCKAATNLLFPLTGTDEFLSEEEIEDQFIPGLRETNIFSILNPNPKDISIHMGESVEIRLYKSVCYSILLYSFNFPKYFMMKMLPIVKETIKILQVKKIPIDQNIHVIFEQYKQIQGLYIKQSYILNCIHLLIRQELQYHKDENQLANTINKCKQTQYFFERNFPLQFKYTFLLLQKLLGHQNQIFENLIQAKREITKFKSTIFNLPSDIVDLYKQCGQCKKCNRYTSEILICFLCCHKICQTCKEEVVKHAQMHKNNTIYIKVEQGTFLKVKDQQIISINIFYADQIGDMFTHKYAYPKRGKYLLSLAKRNQLIDYMLDEEMNIEQEQSLEQSEEGSCALI